MSENIQSMKLVGHRTAVDPSMDAAPSEENESLLTWMVQGTLRWRGESEEHINRS